MWWITIFTFLFSKFMQSHFKECYNGSSSLIILKPDILQRNLQFNVLKELNHLNITCQGKFTWTKELAMEFYRDHQEKSFFPKLVESLAGKDSYFLTCKSSIEMSRSFILHLRRKYAINDTCNSFHGSDSSESFYRELNLILK